MAEKQYIAIDLKSFYASVECVQRGLDPLNTNLVVADESRTEKTICLAVSPSLKAYGIPGRARLFEVVQRVKEVNAMRLVHAPGGCFSGKSHFASFLNQKPEMELDYIVAKPQMAKYMKISTQIYKIYLKYIAPEDIHVYSVDEVFIDATNYLKTYKMSAKQLADKMIRDVLDEMSYRRELWVHKPITDFWRIGKGYSKKLAEYGMFTMGDVARCSVVNSELLYRLFGVNAELLIDHAWGWEPCEISDIKSYVPENRSISSGQVLSQPYTFEKARLVVREMTEQLVLDLVDKGVVTNQIVLTVGYDVDNLKKGTAYKGKITVDWYGRKVPGQAHGSQNIGRHTSSASLIVEAAMKLFDRIVDRELLVRRMYVVANNILYESKVQNTPEQLDMFTDYDSFVKKEEELKKEKNLQKAVVTLQKRFGKNAVLKGMNLKEGATAIERNGQIGGHKA